MPLDASDGLPPVNLPNHSDGPTNAPIKTGHSSDALSSSGDALSPSLSAARSRYPLPTPHPSAPQDAFLPVFPAAMPRAMGVLARAAPFHAPSAVQGGHVTVEQAAAIEKVQVGDWAQDGVGSWGRVGRSPAGGARLRPTIGSG